MSDAAKEILISVVTEKDIESGILSKTSLNKNVKYKGIITYLVLCAFLYFIGVILAYFLNMEVK